MKEIPQLTPYFTSLDIIDTKQLINIASNYVEKATPLIHSKEDLSPELDEEYIKKIVAAGLLNEKNAEYFLAEISSLIGQGKLTPETVKPQKIQFIKKPESFVATVQQNKPFRPSEKILELISEPVTKPHMYDLLQPDEKMHIDEIGAALRKDVRARIQRRIENDGSELDVTPPSLDAFVQQIDPAKCRAGTEAITDIFAYMARDEIAATIKDAMRPQTRAVTA